MNITRNPLSQITEMTQQARDHYKLESKMIPKFEFKKAKGSKQKQHLTLKATKSKLISTWGKI